MIVEAIGRFLWRLVPSTQLLFHIAIPGTIVALIVAFLWPKLAQLRRKITLIDRLPGPICTSFILGNMPADILKSMISNADHKNLIISEFYR